MTICPPRTQPQVAARLSQLTLPAGAMDGLLQPVSPLLQHCVSWDIDAETGRLRAKGRPLAAQALIFAGDHAVAVRHAVSAYPAEITPLMVKNFVLGGAAMSALCRAQGLPLTVWDVGTAGGGQSTRQLPSVGPTGVRFHHRVCPVPGYPLGARDLVQEDALCPQAFEWAWAMGEQAVEEALSHTAADVLILGEMGIGNTTPATAVGCSVLGLDPMVYTGAGTGLPEGQRAAKAQRIGEALKRVGAQNPPLDTLRRLGGFEVVALSAAAKRAAERGVFVLLDGVIVTAAVAAAAQAHEGLSKWCVGGHLSKEPLHGKLLGALGKTPLVDLGLRLGEGSGAALAWSLLKNAEAIFQDMAVFADLTM